MKTLAAITLSLILAVSATTTFAGDSGINLGLRAGYGVPLGSAVKGTDLNKLTSGAVPAQVELSYRFDKNIQAGAYFSYGPALLADEAKSDLTALGATDVKGHRVQRVGVQGIYNILPEARISPWGGMGFGYNWTRYAEATIAGKDTELGLRGFEAIAQVGGDYRLSPAFSVGPFASASFGQFRDTMKWVDGSGETSAKVNDKGIHEWLEFGIRTTYSF